MVLTHYSIPDPKDYDVDVAQVVEQDVFKLQIPMNAVIDLGTSDIQTYFRGKSVLITGATGFLGKLLIEKLLRACEIKKLYLLMRNKKGKNIQERLDYILSDPLFDTVRNKKPDFIDKIVVVSGNISHIRLALSDDDWKLITSEVNQIFHLAATTKFDEHIRIATLINVRGTREILELANECKNLTSFVHVSTAYSTASRSRIDQHIYEQFYPVPIKPEELISFAENYDETKLDDITKLMDDWPNTYAFTKVVAEEVVRTRGANLPVCVVRPPIVCGAYYEPLPGWVDTNAVLGPTGVYLGLILGAIHVVHTSRKPLKQVFIPADYVTNATIAAAWNTAIKPKTDATKIYTISTIRSTQECGWSLFSKLSRDEPHLTRIATPAAVWFGYGFEIQNKFIFWLLHWIIHLIPAYFLDLVFFLFRLKKPPGIQSFVKIYDKIYKLSILNGYFLTNQWYFHDENTLELFEKLSAADKAIFNFDIHTINWELFTYSWGLGIRKYIIKDGLKDSSYGQKKQKWFKVANCIFFILYALAVWKILALFWSLILLIWK